MDFRGFSTKLMNTLISCHGLVCPNYKILYYYIGMCTPGLRFRWSNHRELSLKRLYCQLKLYSPGAYSTGVLSWPQNVCSFQLSCKREPAVYPLLKGIMRLYSSELVQIHRWGGGGHWHFLKLDFVICAALAILALEKRACLLHLQYAGGCL